MKVETVGKRSGGLGAVSFQEGRLPQKNEHEKWENKFVQEAQYVSGRKHKKSPATYYFPTGTKEVCNRASFTSRN